MDPSQTEVTQSPNPEKAPRRKPGSRVHSIVDGVTGIVRTYYREGVGRILPEGVSRRLPYCPVAAAARIRELDALCIPVAKAPTLEAIRRNAVDGVAAEVLISARKRAKRCALPFDLTSEDIESLLGAQDYRCALSGLKFQPTAGKDAGTYRGAYRPSLDRIRPKLGYVRDNVRLVLVAVNVAMSDWGEDVLLDIARALVKRDASHPRKRQPPRAINLED